MKIKLLAFFLLCFGCASAQIINFPDEKFKWKILSMETDQVPPIDTNFDMEISVAEAENAYYLDVSCNGCTDEEKITSLEGLQYFTNLHYFFADRNLITVFDATNHPEIEIISINENDLTSINVAGLTELRDLDVAWNALTELDLTGLVNLDRLICMTNELSTLNIPDCPIGILNCSYNNLATLDLSGIENLQVLHCNGNNMTNLQLPITSPLSNLNCGLNNLTALDLSAFYYLDTLLMQDTNITTLDISANPYLNVLAIDNNAFQNIDLSFSENLKNFSCSNNEFTQLDLSNNLVLEYFNAAQNGLTNIDLTNNTLLKHVDLSENNLTTLDLSLHAELNSYYVNLNPNLVTIFVKNGGNEFGGFYDNPSLQYICADESEVAEMQNYAVSWGQSVQINSYCSFEPGGDFYTVTGSVILDANNNGCGGSDALVPGMKFNISGADGNQYLTGAASTYGIHLQQGSHTITPILENPAYFAISPTSITVDFPASESPLTQHFCLTPTGIHHDVEITFISTTPAQPGFDAAYKIIYRNNGTQISSGQITLEFQDDVLDLIQSSPLSASQSANILTWNFSGLQPFEVRTIDVTMNLNTPMETPALQGGETLLFTASIVPGVADETIADNVSNLDQPVVNSFDPNDKTCHEGATVGTEVIGEYVHYTIRFENTGSAPAQNIVVRDVIDPLKYNIASLIPIHGSHSFRTSVTGNRAEFIFENIMLPFAPSVERYGYVTFKVKLKNNLSTGDTFSNTAEIYFDYNYPIITEPAITSIQTMGIPAIDHNLVSIYPNPATSIVNIVSGQIIEKAEVYDLAGRLLQHRLTITNQSIDVQSLPSGIYLLKMFNAASAFTVKLIRE